MRRTATPLSHPPAPDESPMDKTQQVERIQRIVHRIAVNATEQPPETRATFILDEIAKARDAFRQTYAAAPRLLAQATELVDPMEERIHALVTTLESDGNEARSP